MPTELPVSGVIPVSEMAGEDEYETARFGSMEAEARMFLSSFDWCREIREFYFGGGVGDVIAVFFARISPARPDIDEFLWIVVGDIPPAYLVTDDSPTPKEALQSYIEEMRQWVVLATAGKTSAEVIPVNVPATPEWAEALGSRLDFLEHEIIAACLQQDTSS